MNSALVMALKFWAMNILLALDQLLNAVLWGDPMETLSRRAGQARDRGTEWGCVLCHILDDIDPQHCLSAQQRIDVGDGGYSVAQRLSKWRASQAPATPAQASLPLPAARAAS
jgi:hypothetical protein